MKQRFRLPAGMLAAAVLLQSAAMIPLPFSGRQTLTAHAAEFDVQSNQRRVFEYHFETFTALYDVSRKKWFDTSYNSMKSDTPPVQTMTAADAEGVSLTLHFDTETAEITDADGNVRDCSALFRQKFFSSLDLIKPEFKPTYYDKAQQREVAVPEPENFPLTILCTPTFNYNMPAQFVSDIWLGNYLCGYFGFSLDRHLDWFAPDDPGYTGGGSGWQKAAPGKENYAEPFTDNGDANLDRSVDISDAVLSCRISAEDRTVPVTELGLSLADRNNDGAVDVFDVNDVLFDVAQIPYENRVPSETVPVLRMQQGNDADYEALFGEPTENEQPVLCVQNGDYDDWYFGYSSVYFDYSLNSTLRFYDYDVKSLTLDAQGVLQVDALVTCDEDEQAAPCSAVVSIRVPHGRLSEDTRVNWNLTAVQELPPYTADIRYIPVRKPPEDAIPLSGFIQPATVCTDKTWDALAKNFGFADGTALDDEFTKRVQPTLTFQVRRENGDTDIWDFAYVNGWLRYGWQNAGISQLSLTPDNRLSISADAEMLDSSDEAVKSFIWCRIAVPHGSLPQDLESLWSVTSRPDDSSRVLNPRYIDVVPNVAAIKYGSNVYVYSGLTEGEGIVPDYMRERMTERGITMTHIFYTNANDVNQGCDAPRFELSDTNQGILAIYLYTDEAGFDNTFGVSDAHYEDGILTVTVAEYRPLPDETIPPHYSKILIPFAPETTAELKDVVLQKTDYFDKVNADGELEMMKDDFVNAVQDPLTVIGDMPFMVSEQHCNISVAVTDGVTGEPLPDCRIELKRKVLPEYDITRSTLLAQWNTSEDENGIRTIPVTERKINGVLLDPQDQNYCISTVQVPEGYVLPPELYFDTRGAAGTDGRSVQIRVYPQDAGNNIHFRFYDHAAKAYFDPADEATSLGSRSRLILSDQNGSRYLIPADHMPSGIMLPDGQYSAELHLRRSKYTFADTEEIFAFSEEFGTESGLPSAYSFSFDIQDGTAADNTFIIQLKRMTY